MKLRKEFCYEKYVTLLIGDVIHHTLILPLHCFQ